MADYVLSMSPSDEYFQKIRLILLGFLIYKKMELYIKKIWTEISNIQAHI